MKAEYFPSKNWYISKRNKELFRVRRVIKKFLSVKRLDGFVLCIQG